MKRGFLSAPVVSIETKRLIAERYAAGESTRTLAAKHSVNRSTIYAWLRELGIARRSISQSLSVHFGPLERRFDEKYVAQPNGCWLWTAGLTDDGYPRFESPGESKAHRYSYTRHVGPIPAGLELDHTCKNRACVNPAHLEPVTHLENVRRAWSDNHA